MIHTPSDNFNCIWTNEEDAELQNNDNSYLFIVRRKRAKLGQQFYSTWNFLFSLRGERFSSLRVVDNRFYSCFVFPNFDTKTKWRQRKCLFSHRSEQNIQRDVSERKIHLNCHSDETSTKRHIFSPHSSGENEVIYTARMSNSSYEK